MCNALDTMHYPPFFDTIKTIKLRDPLADFLGALEDGYVEFCYLDIVKSAGHSCPTVSGAYLMALCGLKALYGNDLPVRGEIRVDFQGDPSEGVNGVIANIFTQITGATQSSGFKGIGGDYARDNLLHFHEEIDSEVKLTNTITGESVEVCYSPEKVAADPLQTELMAKIMNKSATAQEIKKFKSLWQGRVEKIFNSIDDVIDVITLA